MHLDVCRKFLRMNEWISFLFRLKNSFLFFLRRFPVFFFCYFSEWKWKKGLILPPPIQTKKKFILTLIAAKVRRKKEQTRKKEEGKKNRLFPYESSTQTQSISTKLRDENSGRDLSWEENIYFLWSGKSCGRRWKKYRKYMIGEKREENCFPSKNIFKVWEESKHIFPLQVERYEYHPQRTRPRRLAMCDIDRRRIDRLLILDGGCGCGVVDPAVVCLEQANILS